jgi:hypothetical protein
MWTCILEERNKSSQLSVALNSTREKERRACLPFAIILCLCPDGTASRLFKFLEQVLNRASLFALWNLQ